MWTGDVSWAVTELRSPTLLLHTRVRSSRNYRGTIGTRDPAEELQTQSSQQWGFKHHHADLNPPQAVTAAAPPATAGQHHAASPSCSWLKNGLTEKDIMHCTRNRLRSRTPAHLPCPPGAANVLPPICPRTKAPSWPSYCHRYRPCD